MMNMITRTLLFTLCLSNVLTATHHAFADHNRTILVSVEQVKEREIIETEAVSGTLVAREEILVLPEMEGLQITDVLVDEGDYVAKGQVLVRLSHDMLDIQILKSNAAIAKAQSAVEQSKNRIIQVEATLTEARQSLERVRTLKSSGNSTDVQLEKATASEQSIAGQLAAEKNGLLIARAELQSAQSQHEELLLRLAKTNIKAPEAGIISRRNARLGAIASASANALFHIIANGEIELEGEISNHQASVISPGKTFHMQLDNGEIIKGEVRLVSPEISKITRMGKIRVSLPAHPDLRIGAFARGEIEITKKKGMIAPLTSIINDKVGSSVFVATRQSSLSAENAGDDKAEQLALLEQKNVTIKPMNSRYVEILEGLKPDDLVVVRAGAFVSSGDLVRIDEISGSEDMNNAP